MSLSFSQIIAYGLFVFSLFLIFLNSSFISKSLTKAITIYNSQRPSDISNRSLPPAPPPPMGTQIPNPIGPPSIPMQEHSLINQTEPPTTSNFQNRGLCGLRWGLKNKTLLDVWRFLKHFGGIRGYSQTTLTRFCLFWPPTPLSSVDIFYLRNIDKKYTFGPLHLATPFLLSTEFVNSPLWENQAHIFFRQITMGQF